MAVPQEVILLVDRVDHLTLAGEDLLHVPALADMALRVGRGLPAIRTIREPEMAVPQELILLVDRVDHPAIAGEDMLHVAALADMALRVGRGLPAIRTIQTAEMTVPDQLVLLVDRVDHPTIAGEDMLHVRPALDGKDRGDAGPARL